MTVTDPNPEPKPVLVAKVEWDGDVDPAKTINLVSGNESPLTVIVTSEDSSKEPTNTYINWISTNPEVLSVEPTSEGALTATVKAHKEGGATILAAAADGSTEVEGIGTNSQTTASFSVDNGSQDFPYIRPQVILEENKKDLEIGETYQLKGTVDHPIDECKTIAWYSTNTGVAKVSSAGLVTAVGKGDATIVARATNGPLDTPQYCQCKVHVVDKTITRVKKITLNAESTELDTKDNNSFQLTAGIEPENVTNPSILWISSNPFVATVDDGLITAVGGGSAKIRAYATDGSNVFAECSVAVSEPEPKIKVNKIELDRTENTLLTGDTFKLTATISPDIADNKEVKWTSDKPSIASVDNEGNVTAASPGEARIRVEAKDGSGKYDVCTVTVTSNAILVDGI